MLSKLRPYVFIFKHIVALSLLLSPCIHYEEKRKRDYIDEVFMNGFIFQIFFHFSTKINKQQYLAKYLYSPSIS